MTARLTVALALIVVATTRADQQRPGFRSGIDLVTLDVTAIGQDGWPVRDLRPDEVTLSVDGQVRPIKSFEYVEVAPRTTAASPGTRPSAGVGSNLSSELGRSVFIVVLHDHIRRGDEHQAIQGAVHLVDQLTSRDRVAVVTMPFGRVEVDLTSDFKKVKARLPQIVGHSGELIPKGMDQTSEAKALMDFLTNLTRLDGPKTVVLISEGFNAGGGAFLTKEERDLKKEDAVDTGAVLLSQMGSTISEITNLRTAAAAARASFYVIQPYAMVADAALGGRFNSPPLVELDAQTRALASVASVTGGQFFQLSGTATSVFDRILRETSGYYTVAIEADEADRANPTRMRSIVVRTSRGGVTVRARRTYLNQGATSSSSAKAMLGDLKSYRDVPLRTVAYTTRATNGKVKVLAVADPVEPTSLREVAFGLVGSDGKIASAWPGEIKPAGTPVVGADVVAPGRYRLRAAVVDANGRGGAADFEFDAALQAAGPLTAGSLMLGTIGNSGSFQPRLAFAQGERATAYFEVYGSGEIAGRFELQSAEGKRVAMDEAAITPTRDADRRIVTGSLPLDKLSPGEYTVRAAVVIGGKEAGTLSTSLRIVTK